MPVRHGEGIRAVCGPVPSCVPATKWKDPDGTAGSVSALPMPPELKKQKGMGPTREESQ